MYGVQLSYCLPPMYLPKYNNIVRNTYIKINGIVKKNIFIYTTFLQFLSSANAACCLRISSTAIPRKNVKSVLILYQRHQLKLCQPQSAVHVAGSNRQNVNIN